MRLGSAPARCPSASWNLLSPVEMGLVFLIRPAARPGVGSALFAPRQKTCLVPRYRVVLFSFGVDGRILEVGNLPTTALLD